MEKRFDDETDLITMMALKKIGMEIRKR